MSIDHSTGCPTSKKYTVNQGCMSLSTYLLECGRHVARLRRRRRAYAPTSNTASHDNHKKILHGFPFLSRDDYGAPLGGPSGRRSSAMKAPFMQRVYWELVLSILRLQLTSSPPCWMTINKRILMSFIVPVIQHDRQGLCYLNLSGMVAHHLCYCPHTLEQPSSKYCRFSHDVTKIQTTKLLNMLIFYFNEV